ncbi:hypothetical protein [Dactylococcopsis salina]|uniref:Uncharacterized protein n=1 Tax=Dactylococcopsis salina (strain PCC 8305) TaxID=13035 RepID=K9YVY3_DACS8|nr:hypothetical protein [Dactylococcopsis salina]AFZ51091.1 hypothetical protein Dacsa_2500 [Dactylococcopsis salina PCC 8305]
MNTQLIESIIQLIKSLTPEEQALIEAKLHTQEDWENEHQELLQLKRKVSDRVNSQPFNPPIEKYLNQAKEERIAQQDEIISNCFNEN